MSLVIVRDAAIAAINDAELIFKKKLEAGILNRPTLYVVVATRRPNGTYQPEYERAMGDPDNWEYPFDVIARGKADLTARTGVSSREAQLLHPMLLNARDIMYWGGVITDNLIVACSGVQSFYDEYFAKIILADILAANEALVMKARDNEEVNHYPSGKDANGMTGLMGPVPK